MMRRFLWSPTDVALQAGSTSLLSPVRRVAVIRLPKLHLHYRKPLSRREVEDELGDVLSRRVYVHDEQRLALLLEKGQSGIILVQQHLVIEMLVDPAADDALDLGEIADHAEIVEIRRRQRDDGAAVVPVQMTALARIF